MLSAPLILFPPPGSLAPNWNVPRFKYFTQALLGGVVLGAYSVHAVPTAVPGGVPGGAPGGAASGVLPSGKTGIIFGAPPDGISKGIGLITEVSVTFELFTVT